MFPFYDNFKEAISKKEKHIAKFRHVADEGKCKQTQISFLCDDIFTLGITRRFMNLPSWNFKVRSC